MWNTVKGIPRRIWKRLYQFDPAVKSGFQVLLVVTVLLVGTAGVASVSAIPTLGAMLQLGGFLTVAVGIEKTLQHFGREPFWNRLKEPFDNFWNVFAGSSRTTEATLTGGGGIVSTSVRETVTYSDDLPLEERVDLIKEEVERLESKLNELDERIDKETQRLEEKIEEETGVLADKVHQLKEMVERANVGDITLRLEWLGVYLLISGLLVSTFPSTAYAFGKVIGTGLLAIFGI